MLGNIYTFPLDKNIWVVSIDYTSDPDSSVVFSEQHIEKLKLGIENFDFSQINTVLIATGVAEALAHGDHTNYLDNTIKKCREMFTNLDKLYLFHTTVRFRNEELLSKHKNLKIINFDYFLLRSTLTNRTQFTSWSSKNKKAIYLPGDIRNREHKFQLLYYFKIQNNLDHLTYSLLDHYTKGWNSWNCNSVYNSLNEMFKLELNFDSFKILYQSLSHKFEGDNIFGNFKYDGLNQFTHIFPPTWNDSSCNIIAESIFFDLNTILGSKFSNTDFFLSEKVWKPILSGKPFVALSENDGIYQQLEAMGFKTFLNYTSYPNKAELHLSKNMGDFNKLKKYLKICHDRVISFLECSEKYEENIREDIDHNIKQWKLLSKNAWRKLYDEVPELEKFSKSVTCEIFNHCPDLDKICTHISN